MYIEEGALEQPEFDPARLQYARVRCRNGECREEFVCTPHSEYYGSNGVTNDEGVFIDGQCEPCMLADIGMQPLENPVQVADNAGIIGEPTMPEASDQ